MKLQFNNFVSNAMRISFGLAMANVVVLLCAYSFGMLPTRESTAREQRLTQSQMLATQLSTAIETGDADEIQRVSSAVLGQMPQIQSLGVRREDGSLLFASENHAGLWAKPDTQGAKQVNVPLMDADREWGRLELVFEDLPGNGSIGLVGVCLFVSCMSLVAFRLFIRRVLKALDPSQVIPERVRAMLDTMAEGAMLLSTDCRIVLTNTRFQELISNNGATTGKDPSCFDWSDAAGPVTPDRLPWSNLTDGKPRRGISLRLQREGALRMFSVNATPICGDQKTVRGMLVTFDDVTAIEEKNTQLEHTVRQLNEAQERVKKQNEELRRMATRDGLTGVFNRRSFQVQFASLFEDSTRTGKPLSLIMVDIDHFKSVNDKHGHAKGDAVLQQVAQFLLEGAGPSDVVARYGGEEFCILLPDSTASAAFQVAEQIRANLSNDQIAGLDITASFGVCGTETTCDNELQLAHFADEALYFSKRNGRDRVSNYSQIAALIESPDATEYKTRPSIPNEAVSALISALHFRDPLTAQHSRRVSALCVEALAGAIDQHDLKVLEVAALLHDIGKIGVPDSILLKPGPLNDEERQLMDTHDRIGIAILESSFKHEEIAAIVRAHHAHFDGSGARCGAMRGAEIPLRARILSIADAYDAMTDDRPYRNAMSRDLAIAELKRCAGTQFDPILVDRFVAFIEQSERPSMQQSVIDMTLRLGLEVERLTAAVERQELMLARAVAQRLQALSTSVGHAGMATAAAKVANALSRNLDAQTVSSEVRNLLNSYSAYCEMVTVSQQIAA